MRYISFLVMTLLFFLACSSSRKVVQNNSSVNTTTQKDSATVSIDLARSYVQLGKNAEQIGDTLGADHYFGQAIELVNELRENVEENADTTSRKALENLSLEYARYLARLNGIEEDSLAAADVMSILSALEDSASTGVDDSAVVSIPDVIDGDTKLRIPLVLNQKVENALKYFQGKGRRVFTKWLQRSGWYRDMISGILEEEGVPPELLYLAMIESGFNPAARSYARAVGMWQFIYSTGKSYGLTNSWWYDERQDPEKSTRAAARHLKDLHERFDNWYIAIAGYNFSPGKIEHRIKKYQVDEFWDLPRLPRQTRNYVPTFIAAALIAQDPEKYGFFVEPEAPVTYDTVTVRESVDLNVVAKCVDSDFAKIKKLNPGLLRFCTPPDKDSWVLNIPDGTREQFLREYAKVPQDEKLTWIHHKIRSGETLSTIARRYGVNMAEIKRFNHIRGTMIRAGHSLVIPVPQDKSYAAKMARSAATQSYPLERKPVTNVPGRDKKVHVVKKGETLWEIASGYKVSLTQIRKWNGLGSYSRLIRPGQRLNVWLPRGSELMVSDNEDPLTNSGIAQVETSPGGDGKTITYIVRRGDTLWDIANRHGVSIRNIKLWNNRRSNKIKPGEELKIFLQ